MIVINKKGLWYKRGFDSADRKALLKGEETPEMMRRIIGNQHGVLLHRYPKKSAEFTKGYWDSIDAQRAANNAETSR